MGRVQAIARLPRRRRKRKLGAHNRLPRRAALPAAALGRHPALVLQREPLRVSRQATFARVETHVVPRAKGAGARPDGIIDRYDLYICICIYYLYIYIYVSISIYLYIYIYLSIYLSIYIYKYLYIYIYIYR